MISIGSAMVSWSSRKQGSVALGTADAEFISASVASWKLHGFGSYSLIYIDSSLEHVVISMTTRAVSNIKDSCVSRPLFETHGDGYHFFYDMVRQRAISLRYLYRLTKQTADVH